MDLRDYLKVLRARKWIIIESVVIVAVSSVVFTLLQPRLYVGQAKVLISSQDAGTALLGSSIGDLSGQTDRNIQTQAGLIRVRPLAEATIRDLGLGVTPDELLKHVVVTTNSQTNLVVVSATAENPERAADIANAMANGYVQWSRDTKRESIQRASKQLEPRLAEAQAQVLALGRKILDQRKTDKFGNVINDSTLQAELTIATSLYASLIEKLETLRVNEQLETSTGRVVSSAIPNPLPISENPLRSGFLGLLVGLALGVSLAFLLEYLDNTIKSADEAEKLYGGPVLGQIPLERFATGEDRRLTIVQHPGSSVAESYRALRNSLDFINFQHDMKVLLVSSSAPGEGKSTVAANLAAGLAQSGNKVVLLNSDFRRPTTDQFFAVTNAIGLSDVLTGASSLKSALQRSDDEQLLLLTAGKMPPNPSELLGSEKMSLLIDDLKEWADWIIIDSPPLLAVADAAAIARWVDGVLMVSRAATSTRESARKGREMLDKVGAHIVGGWSGVWARGSAVVRTATAATTGTTTVIPGYPRVARARATWTMVRRVHLREP